VLRPDGRGRLPARRPGARAAPFASPANQAAFSAVLEAELKAIAEDGRLPEPFFDYVIMARKT
jgi:hypothetical protein